MGVEPLDPGAQSIKIHPKIGNLSSNCVDTAAAHHSFVTT